MTATYKHPSAQGQRAGQPVNKVLYSIGLAGALFLFVWTAAIAHTHQMTGWQARVFHHINNLPDGYKTPALWITEGLGAGYPIAACVLVPLLLRRYRLAWRFFFTAGAAGVVMEIVKKIINEPRPFVMLGSGNFHQRAVETGPGFPSGHEVMATALALTLWLILPWMWRWLAALWILVVAVSRIYLGVHAPVDVIGGFAIGLLVVSAIMLLPELIAGPFRLSNDESLLKKYDWPLGGGSTAAAD